MADALTVQEARDGVLASAIHARGYLRLLHGSLSLLAGQLKEATSACWPQLQQWGEDDTRIRSIVQNKAAGLASAIADHEAAVAVKRGAV